MTKPKLEQFEIMAVIPTGPYANLQPKLVYKAGSFEEAYKEARPHLEQVQRDYGIEGNSLGGGVALSTAERQHVKCYLSGTDAYFDPISHTYITEEGEKYQSGSVFAGQFEHEFEKHLVLDKCAKKLELTPEEVELYWSSKGDISTTFGTALHQSLEHYGKWAAVCERDIDSKTKEPKGYGIHPTLLPIVQAFFKGRENEVAVYEPFIADPKKLRCGFVDRFVIVDADKKICDIEDYKTNADLYKLGTPANLKAPYSYLPNVPASRYAIQLSFYASIAEAHGWTVRKLTIHWWNGVEWETIPVNPVEIDVKQKAISQEKINELIG